MELLQQIRQDLVSIDRLECNLISKVIFYPRDSPQWKKQPIDLLRDRDGYFETGLAQLDAGIIRFHLAADSESNGTARRTWDIAKASFPRAAEFIPADLCPWLLDGVRDPVQRWLLAIHMATNRDLVTWLECDDDQFGVWLNGDDCSGIQVANWNDGHFPTVNCYSIAKPLGELSAQALDMIARAEREPELKSPSGRVKLFGGAELPEIDNKPVPPLNEGQYGFAAFILERQTVSSGPKKTDLETEFGGSWSRHRNFFRSHPWDSVFPQRRQGTGFYFE